MGVPAGSYVESLKLYSSVRSAEWTQQMRQSVTAAEECSALLEVTWEETSSDVVRFLEELRVPKD